MPNVTIFMPANAMPREESLAALTEQCTEFCTTILAAALANVHVIYVPVRHGRGHPIFAQIDHRLEPCRSPAVMDRFMAALDDAILSHTGLTARIRCFGYASASIAARN